MSAAELVTEHAHRKIRVLELRHIAPAENMIEIKPALKVKRCSELFSPVVVKEGKRSSEPFLQLVVKEGGKLTGKGWWESWKRCSSYPFKPPLYRREKYSTYPF